MEFVPEAMLDRHVEMVAFSSDGSLVAAGSQDKIGVWSTTTGKLTSRMKLPGGDHYHTLAFTADGQSLISKCRDDRIMRLWDVKTGKLVREVPAPDVGDQKDATLKTFSPDGARALFETRNKRGDFDLTVLDIATGKSMTSLGTPIRFHHHWSKVAFAPDGTSYAFNSAMNQLRIVDAATGKITRELQPMDDSKRSLPSYSFVQYSPDGQFIMAQEHTGRVKIFDIYRYVIWGVADGRRYWEQENSGGSISAGNRYLISDAKSVRDLLSDEVIPIENAIENRSLKGMSRDGKLLAFVGKASAKVDDSKAYPLSIYLTPAPVLPPVVGDKQGPLTDRELEFLWEGTVADNLFRRNHARKALATRREDAVSLAERKLKPATAEERQHIDTLIRRLDDDSPDVRDQATAELEAAAHRFESLLRKAYDSLNAGEVKNRLSSILKKTTTATMPRALVAEVRGIDFLEVLGDAKSRAC
jgi:hypothetical protein